MYGCVRKSKWRFYPAKADLVEALCPEVIFSKTHANVRFPYRFILAYN